MFDFFPGNQESKKSDLINPFKCIELGNIFSNQIVRQYTIMDKEDFNKMKARGCEFRSSTKNHEKQKISNFIEIHNVEIDKSKKDEKELSMHLFKLAANQVIADKEKYFIDYRNAIKELSIEYQVLSKYTSFIGVDEKG